MGSALKPYRRLRLVYLITIIDPAAASCTGSTHVLSPHDILSPCGRRCGNVHGPSWTSRLLFFDVDFIFDFDPDEFDL